jgi:branched-chain amino acid transport system permease protein
MSELQAQLKEWRAALLGRVPTVPGWAGGSWSRPAVMVGALVMILLPFIAGGGGFLQATIVALAYVVMALGLNVVIGFAGLLDLGYVAFYAIGAYTVGWLASGFFFAEKVNVLSTTPAGSIGIHLNFILLLICATIFTSIAGMIIGLPTLRLRGDYIAIVTLAFGEIIGTLVVNGSGISFLGHGQTLTAGNLGISTLDMPGIPGVGTFGLLDLKPWYWLILAIAFICLFVAFRLRDSRLGRAWIALREDEVAAVSMGIPLVKTKLMAYAIGAAFGGVSGVFLADFDQTVNASQFQFQFSIFVVSMVILGGVGSIPGAVLGALLISYINYYLIPDVLNSLPHTFGLNFDLTDLSIGIYGFLLVIVMVLRPQGLWPEARRKKELAGLVAPEMTELAEPSQLAGEIVGPPGQGGV